MSNCWSVSLLDWSEIGSILYVVAGVLIWAKNAMVRILGHVGMTWDFRMPGRSEKRMWCSDCTACAVMFQQMVSILRNLIATV